ncbi:MAG: FAD-dependent oxidoreductase [Deltaproteobacteria bacterium]|nr:FAD-dependent oxidoreductase [Deltaproteobacteria bacterium]
MGSKKEVIIIGGGVIGLACAHYLIENGASVRIIEKEAIGDGASHGNCGLLYFSDVIPLCSPGTVSHEIIRTLKRTSPLYIKPAWDIKRLIWLLKFAFKCNSSHMTRAAGEKYELLHYSISLFDTLMALEEINCDFEKKGLLTVFKKSKNFKNYGKTSAFLGTYGMGAKKIDKKELQELEPAISDDVEGAWLNETDWHLRPDMLMASWRKYLSQKGVIIEEYCKVSDFEINGNAVTGVNTAKGNFKADAFVLATGAWTCQTLKQLKLDLPVQPGKGYSITMERPGICPLFPLILYESNMVATPWKSAYRLGGTMEFSGHNDYLNPDRLSKLISGATAFLREPAGYPVIEEWTGLRPMTYDDMPIIDRAPAWENMIIATGHGMLGLTLATGTGKIVCDMVCGKKPEINIAPFGIHRFS